ncbi:MAG: hypothetical protein ACKOQY_11795 [Bacteroidota bacterium]
MDRPPPRYRVLRILAVAMLVLGALDPIRGAVLIAAGSLLLAIQVKISADPRRRLYVTTARMIVVGVFFLYFFSENGSLQKAQLSAWWLLMLPYPVGWMITVSSLLDTSIRKRKGR